mgnify:CR=1 FL=1
MASTPMCSRRRTGPSIRAEARQGLGLGPAPTFLFVGHNYHLKGLPTVLRALARLARRGTRRGCASSGTVPSRHSRRSPTVSASRSRSDSAAASRIHGPTWPRPTSSSTRRSTTRAAWSRSRRGRWESPSSRAAGTVRTICGRRTRMAGSSRIRATSARWRGPCGQPWTPPVARRPPSWSRSGRPREYPRAELRTDRGALHRGATDSGRAGALIGGTSRARPAPRARPGGPTSRRSPGCIGPRHRSGRRGGREDALPGRSGGLLPTDRCAPARSDRTGRPRGLPARRRSAWARCRPSPSGGRGRRASGLPRAGDRSRPRTVTPAPSGGALRGRPPPRPGVDEDRRALAGREPLDELAVSLGRPALGRPSGEGVDEDEIPRGGSHRGEPGRAARSASREITTMRTQVLDGDPDRLGDIRAAAHRVSRRIPAHRVSPPGPPRAPSGPGTTPPGSSRSSRRSRGRSGACPEIDREIEARRAAAREVTPRLGPRGEATPAFVGLRSPPST